MFGSCRKEYTIMDQKLCSTPLNKNFQIYWAVLVYNMEENKLYRQLPDAGYF